MGCDIHLFVEKKVDGLWQHVPGDFYSGRNYDLFSILACVRNGYGFAGIKTGEGFVPIAMPRGLPEDITDAVAQESDEWGDSGHSHSYFTVAELLKFDWTQTAIKYGCMSATEYTAWRCRQSYCPGALPVNWGTSAGGGGIIRISSEKMDANLSSIRSELGDMWNWLLIKRAVEERFAHHYVDSTWQTPYYVSSSEFLGECLPRLWSLGEHNDVRIVFWFDN